MTLFKRPHIFCWQVKILFFFFFFSFLVARPEKKQNFCGYWVELPIAALGVNRIANKFADFLGTISICVHDAVTRGLKEPSTSVNKRRAGAHSMSRCWAALDPSPLLACFWAKLLWFRVCLSCATRTAVIASRVTAKPDDVIGITFLAVEVIFWFVFLLICVDRWKVTRC